MDPEKNLRHLASSIRAAVHSSPDVLDGHIVDVPTFGDAEYAPSVGVGVESRPKAHRYVEQFGSSELNPRMNDLIEQFRNTADDLIWGHAPGYTKDNVGQEFLDNYCHALLSGPDGPLKCEVPLGAFVLFGPDTFYKDHSHSPNEVYLALTGGGEWRVGEHAWQKLDPGQTIFIPSNAVHAIRTGSDPLLTFSFWLESADMESIEI